MILLPLPSFEQSRAQAWSLAGIFTWAVALCLVYGRQGYMPLDHSIVFDGGWRILQGQVPLRDFSVPAGLVPSLLQAGFFGLLGISWFAYCLHAALCNGAFCLLVYLFLRQMNADRLASAWCAALSAVTFYPPIGVPYLEQHAFLFTLAAIVAARRAGRGGRRTAVVLGACIPVALALGALSKPIPTAFGVPLCALAILRADRPWRQPLWIGIGIGVLAAAAAAAGSLALLGIDWQLARRGLWTLPSQVGRLRWGVVHDQGGIGAALVKLVASWQLASVYLSLGAGSLLILSAGYVWLRRRTFSALQDLLDSLLAPGLLVVCALFAVLTTHNPWTALPYLFASLGAVQARSRLVVAGQAHQPARWRRRLAAAVAAGFLLCALADAWRFHRQFNVTGYANVLDRRAATSDTRLPPALRFLVWSTPPCCGYPARDLVAVVEFFRSHDGNFFLIGDSAILYALTGRPSTSPALWFHPTLTLPGLDTGDFEDWEQEVLARMRRYQVRYVVLERAKTQLGMSLDSFPRLRRRVRNALRQEDSLGAFTILELHPGVWDKRPSEPAARRQAGRGCCAAPGLAAIAAAPRPRKT
jgi:hypothetical protein